MGTASNKHKVQRVLLSVSEACEALSIGRTTLYGLIQAGQIVTIKVGKRGIRIAAREVARFAGEGDAHGA